MNNKRIYAGIIDYLITCVIQTILMGLFFIKPLLSNMGDINTFNITARMFAITYCSVMYLVIRDNIGKKSIGKRIFKLKIVNKSDNNETNFIKRFLRNVTWLLGGIDVMVFLILKERLGDKIFGTNVVEQ
jgi:uncharacterized RDD family membrane protein YckC